MKFQTTKTHLSKVKSEGQKSLLNLSYEDAQSIQVIRDKLCRMDRLLELNSTICSRISNNLINSLDHGADGSEAYAKNTKNGIQICTEEIELQRKRAQTLFQRLIVVAASVCFRFLTMPDEIH